MAEIPGFVPDASSTEQVECPVCYQEYNQGVKRPRLLDCHHIFCTECLQKIHLALPSNVISCPLCRHATPLTPGGALSLPCQPVPLPFRQTTVTQRLVFSVESSTDPRFIILPALSLQVEQMLRVVETSSPLPPPVQAGGLRQRQGVVYVQLLSVAFWALFGVICVVGAFVGSRYFHF
ncbi:RING finger domain-containing protein [Polyodon spathula]|uniref:RING finger domain-containing protein n=1 Tax=Polyodon spathula TaxID=7913 RepID=UPI001B7ECD8E|nr:RING finger domain-containing protein [Polyodon spathula]